MMLKAQIIDAGDTRFLEGQSVHKADITEENDAIYGMKVVVDAGDSTELKPGQIVSSRKLRDENSQDRGDKASNLKPNDAYIDVFIKTLSGYHVGLAEADKSSQNYFKTESLGINSGITQQGGSLVINPSSRATRVIQGYLKAEYDRSFTVQAAVYDNALPEEEWTIYYHYYPVAEGKGTIGVKKDKIPGNAFNSFMFPDIDYKSLGLLDNDGRFMLVSNETFSKATKSLVEKALISGRKANTFKGTIRKYFDKLAIQYKTSPVVYGEYLLFFVGEKVITTYQVPSALKKYLK
jgi:hypothetical protein